MIVKTCPSYPITVFMAGDYARAVEVARDYCDRIGFCVTVAPTTYVYTSGQESGFQVGIINYPRFPLEPMDLWLRAEELADRLCAILGQQSYSIQTPDKTTWYSYRTV